ncbi:hypothetical protein CEE45_05555 [Candidatus Heimdallarchaeota archaeon B3_Heim]|nr:MAG: hypothetical protein CEE45_05555 [Candidatus Heimdallarchaeota archaeon B3_Heim]
MSADNIELEITIDEKGDISYTVNGVKGKSCTETTRFLDEALGEVTNRDFKRDYYQRPVEATTRVTARR